MHARRSWILFYDMDNFLFIYHLKTRVGTLHQFSFREAISVDDNFFKNLLEPQITFLSAAVIDFCSFFVNTLTRRQDRKTDTILSRRIS